MRSTLILALISIFTFSTQAAAWQSSPEYGKAAYYSDKLHGRKTASGAVYDKTKMTCAHKTHPFGTKLRITRVDNNNSVVVEVTDRGPFHEGFVVDLSRAAAERIDLIKSGIARVKVEVVQEQTTTPQGNPTPDTEASIYSTAQPAAAPATTQPASDNTNENVLLKYEGAPAAAQKQVATSTQATARSADAADQQIVSELYQVQAKTLPKQGYGVQVAYLNYGSKLFEEIANLIKKWPGKVIINQIKDGSSSPSFKLLIGPLPDKASADNMKKDVARKGYPKCFVVPLSDL